MYEPLLVFLEAIGIVESGWDGKTVNEAYGFYKQLTISTFTKWLLTYDPFCPERVRNEDEE